MFSCQYWESFKNTYFGKHLRMSASEQSGFSFSKRYRNVTRTLSDKHTKRIGQFHYENEKQCALLHISQKV